MKWGNWKLETRRIGWALLAVLFVFVLHCKIQIFELSSSSGTIDFFRNLGDTFASVNFTDMFVWAAAYLMIRYVSLRDNSVNKWTVVLAALFSVSYVVSISYSVFNGPYFLDQNWYQLILSGFCIIGFFVLFYFCIRTIFLFTEEHVSTFIRKDIAQGLHHHVLLIGFVLILLCWLPWILMNYPGSFCNDSHLQLRQFFGEEVFTSHHPPLSTYIMGALLLIGEGLGDVNFGAFLYLLLQTCIGAWIFSFGVTKLYTAGIRFRCCLLMLLFYALAPFWGCFAQWYEKDLLYAEVATLFLILLIDIIVKRRCSWKEAIALVAAGIVASLLRNNGIYAVIPAVLLLIFYLSKTFRKAVWISLLGSSLVYVFVVQFIYPTVLEIGHGSVKEALSIPFQQTARHVVDHGDEITEHEKKVIDGVLDYASLAESYKPAVSDPVKALYKEDASNLPDYYKVWFQMFWKHPESYISALLNGAYGYMAPVRTNIEANMQMDYGTDSLMTRMGIHRVFDQFPTEIFIHLRTVGLNAPLIKYLSMPGMYTWIVVACAVVGLKRKDYGLLIILVPEIVNILVCIASPLSNAIRYELPVVAAAPLLIGWTVLTGHGGVAAVASSKKKQAKKRTVSAGTTTKKDRSMQFCNCSMLAAPACRLGTQWKSSVVISAVLSMLKQSSAEMDATSRSLISLLLQEIARHQRSTDWCFMDIRTRYSHQKWSHIRDIRRARCIAFDEA